MAGFDEKLFAILVKGGVPLQVAAVLALPGADEALLEATGIVGGAVGAVGEAAVEGLRFAAATPAKRKRKVSAYQKEFGRQMKRLKILHTLKNGALQAGWNPERLMKAAHAAAKRARR